MTDDVIVGHQILAVHGYEISVPEKLFARFKITPYTADLRFEEVPSERSLVDIKTEDFAYKTINLTNETALFRKFAKLENENDFVKFANKFGGLGEGLATSSDSFFYDQAEPITLWRAQVAKMKRAIAIWEHIQSKDTKWLQLNVERDENLGSSGLFTSDANSLKEEKPETRILRAARIDLISLVNSEMKGRVTSRLTFSDKVGRLKVVFTVENLIGFLWLQLSLSIEGHYRYKKCAVCGSPFRLDPRRRGKPKKFCSDACKSKDYRNKKRGASL